MRQPLAARWTRTSSAASRSARRSPARSARGTRARRDGLGGWSLSDHHAYDPVERALHRGDGSTVRAEALPPVVRRARGHEQPRRRRRPRRRELPEGRRARHRGQHRLPRRLRPLARRQPLPATTASTATTSSASAATARSTSSPATAPRAATMTGDGGPAKDAGLGTVQALAAAPDGALIIASYDDDYDTKVIRRVSPGRLEDRDDRRQHATARRRSATASPRCEAHIGARQRHDRRARRHDLLDRALQPARRLEGPPAQARAGRHRHDRRGRRRQAAPRTARPRPRSRSAATRSGVAIGADGSIYVALGRTRRRSCGSTPTGRATRFAGKGVHNERGADRAGRPGGRVLHRRRRTRSPPPTTARSTSARSATTSRPSELGDPARSTRTASCSSTPAACAAPAAPAASTARARPASACRTTR